MDLLFSSLDAAALRSCSRSACRCGSDVGLRGSEVALPEVEDHIDLTVASQVQDRRRLCGERAQRRHLESKTLVLLAQQSGALILHRPFSLGIGAEPESEGQADGCQRRECGHPPRRHPGHRRNSAMGEPIQDSPREVLGGPLSWQLCEGLFDGGVLPMSCHDGPPI